MLFSLTFNAGSKLAWLTAISFVMLYSLFEIAIVAWRASVPVFLSTVTVNVVIPFSPFTFDSLTQFASQTAFQLMFDVIVISFVTPSSVAPMLFSLTFNAGSKLNWLTSIFFVMLYSLFFKVIVAMRPSVS